MNAPQFVSVYAGQTCIGHVLARSKRGFEAFDTEDNSIGIFASQSAAADVLTKDLEPKSATAISHRIEWLFSH